MQTKCEDVLESYMSAVNKLEQDIGRCNAKMDRAVSNDWPSPSVCVGIRVLTASSQNRNVSFSKDDAQKISS